MQAIVLELGISPVTAKVFRSLPFVERTGLKWHFTERVDLCRSIYCSVKLVDE